MVSNGFSLNQLLYFHFQYVILYGHINFINKCFKSHFVCIFPLDSLLLLDEIKLNIRSKGHQKLALSNITEN